MSKGAGGGSTQLYSGTIKGVFCLGKVDKLVSIIIDGGTVWPTQKSWNDDVLLVPVSLAQRLANVVTIRTSVPHSLKGGNKFQVSGVGHGFDGTFDVPEAGITLGGTKVLVGDMFVKFHQVAVDFGPTAPGGTLSKVVHYAVDAIVRYASGMWICILAHDAVDGTQPPNATYWNAYSLNWNGVDLPQHLTLPGFGNVVFYWGTATQNLDVAFSTAFRNNGHPPYRQQSGIELVDFLFGTERQGPPNIEAVLVRKPVQALIAGGAAELDGDDQANPMAVIAELLTDPIVGCGQAVGRFDAASWQAVANALAARSSDTYVSVYLDKGDSMRSVLALLLAYFDGWLRFNAAGLVEAGRFLHNEAPPAFTDATTIDFHDLVKEIEFDADGWSKTFNETIVKFQDGQRAFKDAGQSSPSGYNRRVNLDPRRATLDRPFITRQQQASNYAAEWAKLNAQPQLQGQLVVRREKATAIKPGTLFKLTHDALQLSVVCRCTEKTLAAPPVGQVTLAFASERAIAPLPFQPTSVASEGTALPPAEAINQFALVQPPYALIEASAFQIMILAARTTTLTRGIRPWFRVDDGANFFQLGEQRRWAVFGKLAQNYAALSSRADDDSESLRLNLEEETVEADLEAVMATQTDDAIADNSLLVWLMKEADPTQWEICTVKAIRLDAGVYKFKVRRGRFGSTPLAFTTGDSAWILYRDGIQAYTHRQFEQHAKGSAAAVFRLQSFTTADEGDLTDDQQCPDINYAFTDPHLPTVSWVYFHKKAVGDTYFIGITDFDAVFANTTKFNFSFDFSSTGASVTLCQLMAQRGGKQIVLGTQSFEPSTYQPTQPFEFTLPDGTWEIYAVVTERSGRVTSEMLTIGGTEKRLNIGAATKVQNPILAPPGGEAVIPDGFGDFLFNFTLSCPTAGATVWWLATLPGVAPGDPGVAGFLSNAVVAFPLSWTVTPAIFSTASRIEFWLFATKGGMTDSEVVHYTIWTPPE